LSAPAPEESGFVPRLTLAERDRRHALVRRKMAASGIDVLVLPAATGRWEQNLADSRYLTSIGGFATEALTVFPIADAPTCYVFNRSAFWKGAQAWIADVRDGRNRWSDNVAERLGEIGFVRGRIGVAGLGPLTRSPDGLVTHRTVDRIRALFPAAEIVDATALMLEARKVKSAEEIALMARSTAMAERMVSTVHALRPGDTERTLYAGMVSTLIAEGGDLPAMILIGAGPALDHGGFVPTSRTLASGDLVVGEVEGRYAGYSGQIVRPAVLGRAKPDYRALVEAAAAVFEEVRSSMRAGVALGDVAAAYEAAVARQGGEVAYPLMHARGLGDEIPAVIAVEDRVRLADVVLEEGMTFVLKPRLERRGLPIAQIGDMVAVEAGGGRRLGRMPMALIETAWPAPVGEAVASAKG
jgi:Xaa-Pro dipeptidase